MHTFVVHADRNYWNDLDAVFITISLDPAGQDLELVLFQSAYKQTRKKVCMFVVDDFARM